MTEFTASHETVHTVVTGHRADVILRRPDALNAMSNLMMHDLIETFEALAARDDVWCATLSGVGRAFCVGADRVERRTMSQDDVRRRRRLAPEAFSAMRRYPHPVVAQVHGFALGGGLELMLGCDLAVVAEDAVLGLIETSRGSIPGGGGTRALTRLLGPARARELIYTAHRFTGLDAAAWGLAVEATPVSDLPGRVDDLASRILANSPVAVSQTKKVLQLVETGSHEDGMRVEAEHYERVLSSADLTEAVAAARESRAPRYSNS